MPFRTKSDEVGLQIRYMSGVPNVVQNLPRNGPAQQGHAVNNY